MSVWRVHGKNIQNGGFPNSPDVARLFLVNISRMGEPQKASLSELKEPEREALRALWRRGAVNLISAELQRSPNTIKDQLFRARRTLKAPTSMDAARILAEYEGRHPSEVHPGWVIASAAAIVEQDRAVGGPASVVRDVADYPSSFAAAPLELFQRDRSDKRLRRLWVVVQVATAIIALLTMLAFVMNAVPNLFAWNAFQP